LDADQATQLTDAVFRDSPSSTTPSDLVSGYTFNTNLQAIRHLDFMASTYMLLDPSCYSGRFLKIRPTYAAAATDIDARIAAAAILMSNGTGGTAVDTRMPLYPKAMTGGNAGMVTPCPAEWGTGVQGSTSFSFFSWANSSLGYKWGKALPAWCYDEAWPDGGDDGRYPSDAVIYGPLAGQAILPGCEPLTCKPQYKVLAQSGSIHVQVLPFAHDAWNVTGKHVQLCCMCCAILIVYY
jgi:hypothetical protein